MKPFGGAHELSSVDKCVTLPRVVGDRGLSPNTAIHDHSRDAEGSGEDVNSLFPRKKRVIRAGL